jgi:PAS domain S-box-containing protein
MDVGGAAGLDLLEAVPDAIVIADPGGRIVFANAQTERMFGYSKLELGGVSLEMLIPPRYRKQHVSHVAGFVAAPHVRQMGKDMELLGQRKDGEEFPVEISISPVEVQGKTLLIAIADTGVGIPVEIRDRVFEPFFTTKEVGRGTGQGLALAWSIVHDKHGGALAFETAVGEGTTFVIRLPIAGKRAAA